MVSLNQPRDPVYRAVGSMPSKSCIATLLPLYSLRSPDPAVAISVPPARTHAAAAVLAAVEI